MTDPVAPPVGARSRCASRAALAGFASWVAASLARLTRSRRTRARMADVRAQLTEVSRSRSRLVTAADEQRRRLERELHDGAQQSLLGAGMSLQAARRVVSSDGAAAQLLDEATDQLRESLAELRALARNLRPAMLAERGLPAALAELARSMPIPISLDVGPMPRPAAEVELAVYDVVAQALRQVVGQVGAARATVAVRSEGPRLHVVVAGNGIGGGDEGAGPGLADRVAALDGQLRVEAWPAGGAQVVLDLPFTIDLTGPPGGGS